MALCVSPYVVATGWPGGIHGRPRRRVDMGRSPTQISPKFVLGSPLKRLEDSLPRSCGEYSAAHHSSEPPMRGGRSPVQAPVTWRAVSNVKPANSSSLSPPIAINTIDQCVDRTHEESEQSNHRRQYEASSESTKNKSGGHSRSGPVVPARSRKGRSSSLGEDDGGDDDDDGDGSDDGERKDGPCDRSCHKKKTHFACPFYKYDSVRYMSCTRLRLKRIRDVKQHLNRRHRQPMYCPTCGAVFGDTRVKDAHITGRTCRAAADSVDIPGVNSEQSKALARRVNRSLDEREQWCSIWDILFPGADPPLSPYMANKFEETIGMVHDYWKRHGQSLVAELARTEGLARGGRGGRKTNNNNSNNNNDDDDDVTAMTSRVVDVLLERFRSSSQAAMDPAASNLATFESTSRTIPAPNSPILSSDPSGALVPSWPPPEQLSLEHSSPSMCTIKYQTIHPIQVASQALSGPVETPFRMFDSPPTGGVDLSVARSGSLVPWTPLSSETNWEEPQSANSSLQPIRPDELGEVGMSMFDNRRPLVGQEIIYDSAPAADFQFMASCLSTPVFLDWNDFLPK